MGHRRAGRSGAMRTGTSRVAARAAGVLVVAVMVVGLYTASPALASVPSATSQAATLITDTGATLNGMVNPQGEATAYTFEYGTSTSFGNITTVTGAGSGSTSAAVSAPLTGLSPNTTYLFRLVATNASGTTTGAVMAFTTAGPAVPPSVTTGAASAIGAYRATLAGTVNPNGRQTAFTFEYGTTDTFGQITAVDNAGSAGAVQPVTLPVTGLSPLTTYKYRLVATNTDGTTSGPVMEFTTAANQAPTDIALSGASVAENQAVATTVGTLSTNDPDLGDNHTYTLASGTGDTDNASFQVDGNTLKTNAVFDFETKPSYSIRVRTTDLGNATFEKQFTITITDVVENLPPTDITLSNASVAENQAVATTVGTLGAADTAGDTHTYTLVAGTGSTDNASFQIDGSVLKTNAVFNFETKSSYSIRVRATDQGNLTFEKQLTIAITNVNEAPVTVNDSYTGAIGNTRYVLGTTSTGARVVGSGGNPNANDSDPDAGNTVSCVPETVASTGGGSATINANCSYIFTPGVGDKSQNDTFTYKATDGSLQANGTVTVAITNNLVWYVDRDAGSNGNGTSHSPLQNLAGINGAGGAGDADGASDVIFLYGSATAYSGGLPLEASQQLIGEPQGLTVNAVALVPAAGSNPVIQNAGGTAITLANGVTIRRVNVGTSSGDGISGTNVNTVDIGGASTITGVSGADFKLSGGNGTITFGPAITNTAGRSVDIQGRTGGTVTLSGNISDTGSGILANSNTGATVAFTGDIDASTGTNAAFTATGGGMVTASNTGSTLATTTGTALFVSGVNIGSSNLNFQSISHNGVGLGIELLNTGSSGGLNVTGTAAALSGGTITGSTSTKGAISLTNTDKVSLNKMTIPNADHAAVKGTGVTDFSFTNGSITNAGDLKNNALDAAFAFNATPPAASNNVDGVVTITGNTVTNPYGGGVDIFNFAGTITDANISGNTITSATTQANSKEDGISLNLFGLTTSVASLTKATFNNNTITNFPSGRGITIEGANTSGDGVGEAAPPGTYGTPGSATNVITINGNLIKGDPGTKLNGAAIATGVTGRGQGNFAITNNGTAANPLANTAGQTIGAGVAGDADATFTITGNFVNPNPDVGSSAIGLGTDRNIQADASTLTDPDVNATISNNTVTNAYHTGITVLQSNSNGTANVKVQNNTVSVLPLSVASIYVINGSSNNPAFNPTMCANISNNTAGGFNDGFDNVPGIFLLKDGTPTTYPFGIVGLTPSPADAAQTEANLATQNPDSALGSGFYAGKRAFVQLGNNFSACTLPF